MDHLVIIGLIDRFIVVLMLAVMTTYYGTYLFFYIMLCFVSSVLTIDA